MFQVTDATLETESVEIGSQARVGVTVENLGGMAGTHTVELLADDESVAREGVSVNGRSSETAELSFDPETAGEYDILVDGVEAGTLVVQEQSDDPTTTQTEDDESTGSPADENGIVTSWWLLGLVAAAVVLLGLVVYRRRIGESEADR